MLNAELAIQPDLRTRELVTEAWQKKKEPRKNHLSLNLVDVLKRLVRWGVIPVVALTWALLPSEIKAEGPVSFSCAVTGKENLSVVNLPEVKSARLVMDESRQVTILTPDGRKLPYGSVFFSDLGAVTQELSGLDKNLRVCLAAKSEEGKSQRTAGSEKNPDPKEKAKGLLIAVTIGGFFMLPFLHLLAKNAHRGLLPSEEKPPGFWPAFFHLRGGNGTAAQYIWSTGQAWALNHELNGNHLPTVPGLGCVMALHDLVRGGVLIGGVVGPMLIAELVGAPVNPLVIGLVLGASLFPIVIHSRIGFIDYRKMVEMGRERGLKI